jgi:arylsulfatase A-like enzyme
VRAVMVMFDSLNRLHLPPYGARLVNAPRFEELARRTVTMDRCYAGSLPCIPARRELHTGRPNFLHRSWGPLEPFDDSVPETLKRGGVHAHLATDHQHYWEDGGSTYHTRYTTFELIRGQEGDPWKGLVGGVADVAGSTRAERSPHWWQDKVNRRFIQGLPYHPQTRTFDAGLEFIEQNAEKDNWFLQLETFDPHEPFFSDPSYLEQVGARDDPDLEWPDYLQIDEDPDRAHQYRAHYIALLTMCDASLGRVIDAMDRHRMWQDTVLIVCTDHGFLLGERGWWGKSTAPWFEETVHTPLFYWDPRVGCAGERSAALTQTVDIAASLLDAFEIPLPADMTGRPLKGVLDGGVRPRDVALFGAFGGHVSVTDGRYVYMRGPVAASNEPLFEHTLMPTHMRARFAPDELGSVQLVHPFDFTKGAPVLRAKGQSATNPWSFGTLLFDLGNDPFQKTSIVDEQVETQLANALVAQLRALDAPQSQYERLGLPMTGEVGANHLQLWRDAGRAQEALAPPPSIDEFPHSRLSVRSTLADLLADSNAVDVLNRYAPHVVTAPLRSIAADLPLYRIATHAIGVVPWSRLRLIADGLAALDVAALEPASSR